MIVGKRRVGGSLRFKIGIGCRVRKAREFRQDKQILWGCGCAFRPNQRLVRYD